MKRAAKGRRPNFRVSIACWLDLLGYGRMISDAGFNPSHPNATQAKTRLKNFHRVVAEHSRKGFPTLVINDGAVAYRDLSFRSNSNTYDFLKRSFKLHEAVKHVEVDTGFPGPRSVVCVGFRIPGRRRGGSTVSNHVESVFDRLDRGEIDRETAKFELSAVRLHSDVIPQLQANFAFTKAYLVEGSGSKKGVTGPNFFVERSIFGESVPPGIQVENEFYWAHDGHAINLSLLKVAGMELKVGKTESVGSVRDGMQVAFALTEDPTVREAVQKAIQLKSSEARII